MMGNVTTLINDDRKSWIGRQHMFFVATAPLAVGGHINVSPKGGDTFRVVDPKTVAYLDLTGSGAETIAHVRENGRMVIMFCAFEGAPLIVRLYGKAEVVLPGHPEFDSLAALFPPHPGVRSVIRLHISRVADSCGMAVPFMDYSSDRTELNDWAAEKGPEALQDYRRRKNLTSIDKLPALTDGRG
jgi:Pyridoxamine 5'-phosphate oxidase